MTDWICWGCVEATRPEMLTGYCVEDRCDRCHRTGALALVVKFKDDREKEKEGLTNE